MMGRLMEPSAMLLPLMASAPGGMTRTLFAGKDVCKQPRAVAVCEAVKTAPNPPPGAPNEKADAGSRARMAMAIDKHAICPDGVCPAISMLAIWSRLNLRSLADSAQLQSFSDGHCKWEKIEQERDSSMMAK